MLSCQWGGTKLLTLRAEDINAGGPRVHRSASLVGSCASPLTMGMRQVFSTRRQMALLPFINQVLSIVSYPIFIYSALKEGRNE